MKVVIVESPNKIKKIGQILGSGFKVVASLGHFRDLPGNKMAVDIKNGFTPEYKITKHKVVKDLRTSCANASCVYIATDPDREGEGIAMHLIQVLRLSYPKYRRMTFREITPRAVKAALAEADRDGHLNQAMANAYQARRIVDRVVGYTVSPCLWKHVQGAKSAGRVQSVATRLIADRKKQIDEHKSEEKYKVKGDFETKDGKPVEASLHQVPTTHEVALEVLEHCKTAEFKVGDTNTKIVWHSPPATFKTSVFQQEASKRFGLAPKQAMSVAQKLFEKGKITYHRTDVTTLSGYFIGQAKEYIESKYGTEYLSEKTKKFVAPVNGATEEKKESKAPKKDGGTTVQAAHEAIRPTDINTISLQGDFSELEKKVYRMIWVRAVASLMAREKCRRYTARINLSNTETYWFVATYLMTLFKGYKILTDPTESTEEDTETNAVVVDLKTGDPVTYKKIESRQTFTEPPKRFTESSLVKELENRGIGRPSTFASIVDTIQARKYVRKKNDSPVKKPCLLDTLVEGKVTSKTFQATFGDRKKRLFLTELGERTTTFLVGNLDTLMAYQFTSDLEGDLDKVADGILEWQGVVGNVHGTMTDQISAIPDVTPEQKAERKQRRQDRNIGEFEGKTMEFFVTRYGPAIKHDDKWYNLEEKYESATDVTPDIAIAAIRAKRNKNAPILSYDCKLNDKEGALTIAKGPYGYYIRFVPKNGKPSKKDNYFLPKDVRDDLETISAMTLEDLMDAVEKAQAFRDSGGAKRFGKKGKRMGKN